MAFVPWRAEAVTIKSWRDSGLAPRTGLPKEWRAVIRWSDGSEEGASFSYHASGNNRDGFGTEDKPWFIKVHGLETNQNAEEFQAGRDALSGRGGVCAGMPPKPTGRSEGVGERGLSSGDCVPTPRGYADFPPGRRRTRTTCRSRTYCRRPTGAASCYSPGPLGPGCSWNVPSSPSRSWSSSCP